MAFSTTIKRKYWDMKMEDEALHGYFIEYKRDTWFWRKRLFPLCHIQKEMFPFRGVFLVGSTPHRVRVYDVKAISCGCVPDRYEGITEGWDGAIYAVRCITDEQYNHLMAAKRELKLA